MIKEVTHPQQLVDDALSAGIERCRSEMPPPYDALANQAKSRKITRLNSGIMTVTNKMMTKR